LILARATDPIAFAFDLFEAHLVVSAGVVPIAETERRAPHVTGVLRTADGSRSLIDLASVLEAITKEL
jgi:hypothetical protein